MAEQGRIFISYVREDAERVDRLQEQLERAGPTWRDVKNIWPGEVWKRKLEEAIRAEALAFVPCFSEATAAREKSTFFEELTWGAEEYRQHNPEHPWIFPVFFDKVDPPPLDLGAGQTLHSLEWTLLYDDWDGEVERLVTALRELLPVPEPPQASVIDQELAFPDVSSRLSELELQGREAIATQHKGEAGSLAASVVLPEGTASFGRTELLSAAREAQIDTFGWPIGIVLDRPGSSPVATNRGVRAEVEFEIGGEPFMTYGNSNPRAPS